MSKLLALGFFCLIVVGSVSAVTISYSNPSVGFPEPTEQPIKSDCIKQEWDSNFELFRAGDISKEDMKTYVRSCN